ncbi:DNA polymerase III subunit delta [Bombiscardovia nodaiensis]|uniref:DNA-directed DNA polymerase n=1 Tax=Bombiscardovia nodaiensis TaxID=2932181 RepID=A0ABN6SCW8_9BIFI|nr:DNA polymerase III subunit delta [Bombiscardovia nodaiensis]
MTTVQTQLAPMTIVYGGNAFLSEQTTDKLSKQAQEARPDADLLLLDAATCDAYAFEEAVSPSLLSTSAIVKLDHLENATEALGKAMLAFCQEAQQDTTLDSLVICRHTGGNKGRKLLNDLVKAGARQEQVPDLKTARDKLSFTLAQFQQQGRRVDPQAAQLLVSVFADRIDELAAMVEQLCFDFDADPMPLNIVSEYLTDNPQATSFRVADLAMQGQSAQAMVALRQALEQGVDDITIVGALTYKTRVLAKTAALEAGNLSMGEVGAPPWQVRALRSQLKSWTSQGLARVIESLADADMHCKSNSGDPIYAIERSIRLIGNKGREL